MNGIDAYLDNLITLLKTVQATQKDVLEQAAVLLRDATLAGKNIFAFGCSHAGLLALELYYRTGGMATINPIKAPGLNLDVDPATLTSQIERLPTYGRHIADANPIGEGDVVIIHSVSGRNSVPIDLALRAREKGAKVVALTSLAARSATSRHASGKLLCDVADLVIDNGGIAGDGSVVVDGVPERVGPTSTAAGAAILNAVVVETVRLIAASGTVPPVFVSANVDGGDAHNAAMLKAYKDHIFYMGFQR